MVSIRPPVAADLPEILFLGSTYAGHATRFLNLQASLENSDRCRATFRPVTGWNEGGLVERLEFLPRGVRGRGRGLLSSTPFMRVPRPGLIWTSASAPTLLPYLWSQVGPLHRPLAVELDWTLEQQEEMADQYFGRPAKTGLRRSLSRTMERALWNQVDLFLPWTRWAAAGLLRSGIPPHRIRVTPPGVDLRAWRPRPAVVSDGPLRVLFVGRDFERKGGDSLLRAVAGPLAGRCQVDIVGALPDSLPAGVRAHVLPPNSPELRALYEAADVFVLPTRAECFGLATVEAMASGIPAIVADVGGAGEAVADGVTGWLIEPTLEGVVSGLSRAITDRRRLVDMGRAARRRAEESYDAHRNDEAMLDAILALRGPVSGTPGEDNG